MKGLGATTANYIDQGDDKVIEADHGGIDRVFTSVTFRLGAQSIEVLTLAGDANIGGVGNSLIKFILEMAQTISWSARMVWNPCTGVRE